MLGSRFSENNSLAGFGLCRLSSSLWFKGLLGGSGTRMGVLAAAMHISADHRANVAAKPRYIVAVFAQPSIHSMLFRMIATFGVFPLAFFLACPVAIHQVRTAVAVVIVTSLLAL
jgi:hypothetical protein